MKGLPAPLPEGETLLWQGQPGAWGFVREILHINLLATYVAFLLSWCIATGVMQGDLQASLVAAGKFGGLSVLAFALLAGFAVLQARATTYTVTSARVVIEYGVAFEKALNIPYTVVDGAGFNARADGSGDVVLELRAGQNVSRMLLWPHVRPQWGRTQPALRAVANVQKLAGILSRALAQSAGSMPVAISAVPEAAQASDARARA